MIGTIGALLTTLCLLLAIGYGFVRRRGGPVCMLLAVLFGLTVVAWIVFMFIWAAPAAMDYRPF